MRDSSTSSPMAMPSLSNTSLGRSKAADLPTAVIRSRDIMLPLSGLIVREPCEKARYFWKPNAGAHLLPEAEARHERRLEAVRCSAWLASLQRYALVLSR